MQVSGKKSMRKAVLIVLGVLVATSAGAVPPPPPPKTHLAAIQTFIQGLKNPKAPGYSDIFTDDLIVTQDDRRLADSRIKWLSLHEQALRGAERTVTSQAVYYGTDYADGGSSAATEAIISEDVLRDFGDCCLYYRTETLVFRGDKIAWVKRSAEFDTKLKADGHRQEEP